jgi:diguanylate cyclase (GGDEF)-like protein
MTRENIDSVVRYGGEEFLLILPETDLDGSVQLAERLRQTFASTPTAFGKHRIQCTASFGVVSASFASAATRTPPTGMISAADDLLYAAKKGGRNQVCSHQLAD